MACSYDDVVGRDVAGTVTGFVRNMAGTVARFYDMTGTVAGDWVTLGRQVD
jgi:hypothetical protein